MFIPPATTLGDFLGAVIAPGLGGYIDNSADLKKFTQEIRLSSPASDRLEWQVGGYFTHEIGELVEHLNAVTLPGAGTLRTSFARDTRTRIPLIRNRPDLPT